jgi:protein-S-isoprenylcysteine O-methyltransferase Ste14
MGAVLGFCYGAAAYVIFLFTFLYAVGFIGNFVVPKAVDTGAAAPLIEALTVDVLLLGIFAVQHSVMARPAFKRWWTRLVPPSVERSTYVLFASLALLLLYWQWRPITTTAWSVEDELGVTLIRVVFWSGWALVLLSTFLISHLELFGLRQVFARMMNRALPATEFRTPLFYRHVRHPLYLGFLLAFWAAPQMTWGHLLFSIATTGYILIAIQLEEHDLIQVFGERYRTYRSQVGMLLPKLRGRAPVQSPAEK